MVQKIDLMADLDHVMWCMMNWHWIKQIWSFPLIDKLKKINIYYESCMGSQ